MLIVSANAGTAAVPSSPGPSNKDGSSAVAISFVGDMMFDRGVRSVIAKRGADYLFADVAPELKKSTIVFGSLDCPLTNRKPVKAGKENFRCPASAADAMANAGISSVFLANDHILDEGGPGMYDTFKTLLAAGIYGMGAGEAAWIARIPHVAVTKGIRLSFISFSENDPGPNSEPFNPEFEAADVNTVVETVVAAKAKADVVIVSFHWGNDFDFTPTENQKKLAYAAVEAGAALVVGHGPHVLQPYEIKNGAMIVYSLGNFIYDQKRTAASESAIMTAFFTKQGLGQVDFLPVVIDNGKPTPVGGERAAKILKILGGKRKVTIFE
jgi:gamma-polyglutamate biosynthesis protein CapA